MAIGSMLRQPMKASCLSSVGGSKMPKKVLTRVGKNKNIQLLYFFRPNDRFGIKGVILTPCKKGCIKASIFLTQPFFISTAENVILLHSHNSYSNNRSILE